MTTAVMQDHVMAAGAHVTSHTVTVEGLEPSRLAGEAEHVMSGENAGQTEEDEAEQRERERIRMKEEEDAKRCQVCLYTVSLTLTLAESFRMMVEGDFGFVALVS